MFSVPFAAYQEEEELGFAELYGSVGSVDEKDARECNLYIISTEREFGKFGYEGFLDRKPCI